MDNTNKIQIATAYKLQKLVLSHDFPKEMIEKMKPKN